MQAYSSVLIKAQRGYPLEGYEVILDGMSTIDYIELFEVSEEDKTRLLETCIFNLYNEK